MSVVLAAVDHHDVALRVVDTAHELAMLTGARVEIVHAGDVVEHGPAVVARIGDREVRYVEGEPADAILRVADEPEVTGIVLGARGAPGGARPAGHVTLDVVARARQPVVVVPPDATSTPVHIRRALLPIEGDERAAVAVTGPVAELAAAGVEIIPIHVFDVATVPAFWDQPAHAHDSYSSSFSRRWCSPGTGELRLRRGAAARAVVDAAAHERADLIVLCWSQAFDAGHAPVVRTALAEAAVPVLLVPVPASDRLEVLIGW